MKKILAPLLTILLFSACSTKSQTDIKTSDKKEISELLNSVIEKEKEINSLNRQLEDCKNLRPQE